jgi:Carboxypeptidase regulatory-like domain
MRFRSLLVAFVCLAIVAPLASAQTTGSVSGVVRSKDGGPLPGVTVTISGPQMPRGQTTTTRSDGSFKFQALLPGTYHVTAELTGMGKFEQDVVVALGRDTELYPTVSMTASEQVRVTAELPLVDTKSTEISVVTPKETIEKLPLARTFTGTFQLAPGVAENNSSAPNAGGNKQDNTFLYDGVTISNPFFGDLYQDFAELDLQEVAITRGGVTAEFGRTGGFIVNGVTKSGTNDVHGEARLEYQPASFSAKSKDPNLTSQFEKFRPGVDIGGPIWSDRLFGYGSANLLRQTEKDRVNRLGTIPDGDTNINEYFGKLTANPVSDMLLNGSFRYRGIDGTNAGVDSLNAPSTGIKPKTIDRVIVGSWFWTVDPKLSFEARYNHNEDNNSVVPNIFIPFKATPFNAAAPYLSGTFVTGHSTTNGKDYILPPANALNQRIGSGGGGTSDLAINDQNFFRDEYRLQGSYLANFLGASHDIRAGFTLSNNREDLNRASDGWGTITISDSSNCGPVAARPCYRARLTPPFQQISRAKTYGAFLQDQATWNRLTVNLGVLVNEDYFIPNDTGSFSFIRGNFKTAGNAGSIPACSVAPAGAPACTYTSRVDIPWSKQWQPRIGISYEIDARAHDKVYANAARYDNMDNQSLARSAAPFRALRVDDYINLTTGALITEVIRANQTNKLVIPNMDPTYTDELITGYARPLGNGWSAELWGMYRHSTDIIEDFTATGDGNNFRYGNIPAFRRYRAATLEVRKAYGSNWTVDASYTLSRLDGNWDLDTSGTSIFYSSSYIGDGPGLFPTDPNHEGILQGDRTHIAKLFGTYTLPTRTILGGYLRFQSGRPWEARGHDPVNDTTLMPIEPAGSRRTSSWTNFDFLVAQNVPVGPANLRLEARLLNAFNTQPALTVDQNWCKAAPCLSMVGIPTSNLNPLFGTPTSYASARRFILSAIVTY